MIELCQCGAPAMHETAWEVFVRRHPAGEPFMIQANRLHIQINFRADMNYPSLFSPLQVGPYRLNHRLVIAPLTRLRAEKPPLAPPPPTAEYYRQRTTPRALSLAQA